MKGELVEIENISVKNNGIQVSGNWFTVIGAATQFLGNVKRGSARIVKNNDGQVTFVSNEEGAKPVKTYTGPRSANQEIRDDNKQLEIRRSVAIKGAVDLVTKQSSEGDDIIKLANLCVDVASILEDYIKNGKRVFDGEAS